jgi:hypothetical protein
MEWKKQSTKYGMLQEPLILDNWLWSLLMFSDEEMLAAVSPHSKGN